MAEFYCFPQWMLTAWVMVAAVCIMLQTLAISYSFRRLPGGWARRVENGMECAVLATLFLFAALLGQVQYGLYGGFLMPSDYEFARQVVFLLAAVLSASLVMGGCNGAEEKIQPAEPGITDEAEYDETLGQIYGDAITMDKVLGKDTPYVKVYICLEIGKMLGHTEDDAFQTAVESVTLSEAVQWYASENGVSVSEQAVRDYMEKCFAEIKKTKN